MTDEAMAAFAAFREKVFDDFHLAMRLRPPMDRDAYAAHVVAIGVAQGFPFDEVAVHAALREGEQAWLTQGAEFL